MSSSDPPPELFRVTEASEERELAARQYVRALLAAADAGYSVARIAKAAGVTRQAVYVHIRKGQGER